MKRLFLFAAFAATIPAANWLIGHVGTECLPDGPCLIPVGFGITAPSGVLMIGVALVLRDAIHEDAGPLWALAAVLAGGLLSLAVAPPALALASAAAFTLAELADFAVYAPLRRMGKHVAVLVSGLAGAVVDSLLFSWLAFGSVEWAVGIVMGKLYASVAVAVYLALKGNGK